jgi:hypothetical protein
MKKYFLPLLLLLTFSACTDDDLTTVSKSLLVAAKSINTVQTTVISANEQGLITDETTAQILTGCVKANQAGQQAVAITRSISKLDPSSRTQMAPMVQAALSAIQASLVVDLSGIKNPQTKAIITSGLSAAQTSLNVALSMLMIGGTN